MEPVLKWAGGKRQLLSDIKNIITPESLKGHTLFEPFVGGGAVFLSLEHDSVVINDYNCELINVYQTIRDEPEALIEALELHKFNNNKEYFYEIRNWDRAPEYALLSSVERAARVVYLNRTCFNGLYRVNNKGYFNVPFGRYVNPDIVTRDRVLALHKYFVDNNIKMHCGDFEYAVVEAKEGDTIYFDPPYDYDETGFTSYTSGAFSREDLMRLKLQCDQLIQKGCRVVLSNNDTEFVRDLFSDNKYHIVSVMAKRMINCNGQRRNEVKEVLIVG